MNSFKFWLLGLLTLLPSLSSGQTATVTGIVLDSLNQPIPQVNIRSASGGTTTDDNGFYLLQIKADVENTLVFSHISYQDIIIDGLLLNTNETFEFNLVMKEGPIQVSGVEVTATGIKKFQGITTLAPELVRKIPGANPGVETILKLLPGVSASNELSTQYNVRGGNFDENLVYVNGIEVYRPFLIRSAQQEGFSFVNSNMIQKLEFSAGGFQARYGDKLSSVLDITYKKPVSWGLQAEASLLGGSLTWESRSENKALSALVGLRYRDNGLFVNRQQTQSNYNPSFFDIQSYLSYSLSPTWQLSFLGTFSRNNYRNEPQNRQTNFGTLTDPRALVIFYEGQENNQFNTSFGALQAKVTPDENTEMSFTASLYHTLEEEFSDVIASYELASINTDLGSEDLGEVISSRGAGAQLTRARNQLDALIFRISHRGITRKDNSEIRWGLNYAREDFRDVLRESEFIDSLGFSIRPNEPPVLNDQPETPFEGELLPFDAVRAQNTSATDRLTGFLQWSDRREWKNSEVYYNLGFRTHYWNLTTPGAPPSNEFLFSPRGQFSIKPDWASDVLFNLAVGLYQQPPFYREFRQLDGQLNPEVRAQRAWHFVFSNQYSFSLWDRPFTLNSEAYYKNLSRVNAYTVEDVRIRYRADNDATAYAYGFDFRLNGTFVPGTESWLSVGYLKTEENIQSRGFISRPTDQRLKFGLLFQDYVPSIPNLRLYLNLVYNTGVPGGSPNNEDPYNFQSRLRDYRRADLGISYIFVDADNRADPDQWLHAFKELYCGFELFNMFNNQNSITNTWVRDVETQSQFAVPNFLTPRVLNIKVGMRF